MALLYKDMQTDLVQQMMRRMAAIKPVSQMLDALDGHLSKPLAQLYVITSDEHLLALEAADKIRRSARAQGYSERDVLTVERSFKWGELLAANQALSLFGDKKLIELRIPTGKPGKDGGAALQNYVKDLSPDNLTLITLPKLDWQTQKAAWVASLQQAAVYIDIPNVERAQLPGWIGNRLAAQGQSADRQSIDFIADRVEGNLLAAHQEIQKLALLHPPGELAATHAGSERDVGEQQVDAVSRAQASKRRLAAVELIGFAAQRLQVRAAMDGALGSINHGQRALGLGQGQQWRQR
eukprot:gene32402-36581_t